MREDTYDEDYFLRGRETGKSLYEDYRWLPELTRPMAQRMVEYLGITTRDTVLDFGCARGYTVRALVELGYDAYGCDCSEWAIKHCDESVMERLRLTYSCDAFRGAIFDWIIAKDVLEHIEDITLAIACLQKRARKGLFVVVPLSSDNKTYDVPEYERDITHVHRRPLGWWVGKLSRDGWVTNGCYRVAGIKDNYSHKPYGNGFLTCRRSGS